MDRIVVYSALMLFLCVDSPSHAEDVTLGPIKISAPWVRATPKGAPVGGGYMTITNTGNSPDRLIAGASPISSRFEIHEMSMNNGVMKMRPVAGGVEIAAGATVKFEASGYHLMFVGLKAPFVSGEHVTATLQFEKAGKVDVHFIVEAMGARTGGSSMPHTMQRKP